MMTARSTDDVVELVERHVGCDLDQHRRRAGLAAHARARLHHAGKQIVERGRLLEVAQAWRIR